MRGIYNCYHQAADNSLCKSLTDIDYTIEINTEKLFRECCYNVVARDVQMFMYTSILLILII